MSYLNNFHHQFYGPTEGPKMVFLHGLMGAHSNWRKIITAFEGQYQILAYDQRGHGRSFHPETGYLPEDYADDLLKILDEIGWDRIFLVGHSMGGRNALNFSYRFPHRIEKLVLEDISPESNPKTQGKTLDRINRVPTPFASKDEAKKFLLGPFVQGLGGDKGAMVLAQYFYTNIEVKPDGQADWRFSKEAILQSLNHGRIKDRWHELEGLEVPTLVVRGSQSEELERSIFEKMLKVNPLVSGVEIPDSGHWVHYDQPKAFVDVLSRFFSS